MRARSPGIDIARSHNSLFLFLATDLFAVLNLVFVYSFFVTSTGSGRLWNSPEEEVIGESISYHIRFYRCWASDTKVIQWLLRGPITLSIVVSYSVILLHNFVVYSCYKRGNFSYLFNNEYSSRYSNWNAWRSHNKTLWSLQFQLNFIFFINITRVVFIKMSNSHEPEARRLKYR